MIYCKKIDGKSSDIKIVGDNYTIVNEIATVLYAVHSEYLKNQPQYAPLFRKFIREMAKEDGTLWGDADKEEKYDLQ